MQKSTPRLEKTETDPKQLLLEALDKRWENYRTELKSCQSDFSEESVHDLRVATRRILALIKLLNSIAPHPNLKKMAKAFKEQLDGFDDLRDTQVILSGLAEILPELPQLDVFEQHLHAREEELLQELRGKLNEFDTTDISRWIKKTQESIEAGTEEDLEPLILDVVDDSFLITRQRLGWIDLARPATIHRVRVAFKAFRYMVEIVQPLLRDFPPGNLKEMNEYQTLMGNIQDTEVFAKTLADFMANASLPDLEAVNRYYEKRRADNISAFVQAIDRLHTFWRPEADLPFPWETTLLNTLTWIRIKMAGKLSYKW